MKRKISVGMVGLGQFGTGFVKLFQDHPDVGRIALCDLKPARVAACAKEFGITETYISLDEICKSDLDAIVLITQPWLHAPQAIQVMESGKHVYTAVPVVTSPKGDGDEILTWCDRLVEVVERTGQLYMMGETSYYRSDVVYCRQKAHEGTFGEIVYIESEYLHDTYSPHCDLIEVQMARTGKTASEVLAMGGGVPMHYPTHSTSVPISITGARMTEVSAQGYVYPNDEYYRADSVTGNLFSNEVAVYRMSNGTVAVVREFRRVGHVGREGIVKLLGTEASFERDLDGTKHVTKSAWQSVDVGQFRETDTVSLPEPLAENLGGHGGSHAYLVHEFVDACVNQRMPTVNVWEAVRYVAAGVMAHKSALKDGELLKVPDWGNAPQDV